MPLDNVGGVSCHAAAALRCLLSLESVVRRLPPPGGLRGGGGAEGGLSGTLSLLHHCIKVHEDTGSVDAKDGALRAFRAVLAELGGAPRQEDAHETLGKICESSGLGRLLEGKLGSTVACNNCGARKRIPDPFTFLTSVDAGGSGDACSGLREAFSAETVRGYSCDECRAENVSCAVTRHIETFPRVLAVRCMWAKRPASTMAPLALDLSGCGGGGGARPGGRGADYRMRSALLHVGSAESGHYTAVTLGRGRLDPMVHDDGDSRRADPSVIKRDAGGRPAYLQVPGARLHTVMYESTA